MLSVGDELKDGFDISIDYLDQNISFIEDIKEFYIKRKEVTKEYLMNMKKINVDMLDLITKNSINISVGSKPIMTPGSLVNSSITTVRKLVNDNIDKDLNKINDIVINDLTSLINDLKNLSMYLKNIYKEMMNNYHAICETNLNNYKKKYDEATKNMEQARAKGSSSDKITKREVAMNEAKNLYLIEIALANRVKDKLYFQDIPELLDLLQNTVKFKVQKFNTFLSKHLNNCIHNANSNISVYKEEINYLTENLPDLDVEMFIKHNKKPWQEPQDKVFIASPIWYEEPIFNVKLEEDLKILSIKYKKAIEDKSYLQSEISKQLDNMKSLRGQILEASEKNGLNFALLKQYSASLQRFTDLENQNLRVEVIIDSLKNNFKDINLDNLNFKEEKKKSGIFSKLKIGRSKSKSSNKDSSEVIDNRYEDSRDQSDDVASTMNSFAASSISGAGINTEIHRENKPTFSQGSSSSAAPNAVALYSYQAQDSDEIDISPNDKLRTLKNDVNGWTQVLNVTSGKTGNIPTSYMKITEVSNTSKVPPTVVPRRKKGNNENPKVLCKYEYIAQGDDEISIHPGDQIEVLRPEDENGWALGLCNGNKGLFPMSYC
ncbi:uncharacterized protein HGUI_00373 [Hanseniaspora guilliermondii]|uniref:SH3 domain-containing protein n=1 Tax=Hanseniaspora guilliermondii TaxID=56406 RepID=A0A1L0CHE1_9ASCO|nr:uncharacterized protein HGUI_00373 [Hanseniaspora guilliermondii]